MQLIAARFLRFTPNYPCATIDRTGVGARFSYVVTDCDEGGVAFMDRIRAFAIGASEYLAEVISELRKVVWPNRARTIRLTGVVVAMVALVSIYLFVFDFVLGIGAERFLGR